MRLFCLRFSLRIDLVSLRSLELKSKYSYCLKLFSIRIVGITIIFYLWKNKLQAMNRIDWQMETEINLRSPNSPLVRSEGYPYYDKELKTYFTEDNIPIETVHVASLPTKITNDKLKRHFESFGKVLSVSIHKVGTKYSPYSYGFVTFEEAEVAARVLLTKHHLIGFKRIKVKPADSWNQPGVNKVNANANAKTDETKDENNPNDTNSILNLNDDCLFYIASFLPVCDLVNLSEVCQRFQYIADVVFKAQKYLDMSLLKNCTLMLMRQILSKVGPYVTQVRCSGVHGQIPRKRCIEFIPRYCTSIKHLDFIYISGIHVAVYKKIFCTFKELTTLYLQNCGITDEVCALLFNCANLENLNLSENYEITGKHLDKLHNLKDLNLKYCANLQPTHFIALCKSSKLKALNIERCDRLNKASLDNLSNLQTELETLSISNSYQAIELTPITKLRKLKCLEIRCNDDICYEFFEELAKSQSAGLQRLEINHATLDQNLRHALYSFEKLEDLRIPRSEGIDDIFLSTIASKAPLTHFCCAGCHSITNDGILKLITKSSTIKMIDISSCQQFYSDLILSTIDVLKTLNRQSQLTLIVGNTNITESIQEDPQFIENSKLIKLVYEITHLAFELDEDDDYMSEGDLMELYDVYRHYSDSSYDDDRDGFEFCIFGSLESLI